MKLFRSIYLNFIFSILLFPSFIFSMQPDFVANIPVYVPSDEETSDTDSESECEEFSFSDDEFVVIDKIPFCINNKRRGLVDKGSIAGVETKYTTEEEDLGKINSLCENLESQCFIDTDRNLNKKLSINFGLNRHRSLSNKKNNKLILESRKGVNTTLNTKKCYFFWDFSWERTNKTKYKDRGNPPSYTEVKSYYRQLKKRNKFGAKEFRRKNENQDRRGMVPYRSIREEIKNHLSTKELVQEVRQKNQGADLYLFFCDADTVNFNGCLSTFVQICKDYNLFPTVMTTGYKFALDNDVNHMIILASELDMCVREATAKYIPNGVYYPEPVLCIKVPAGSDTVPESFEVEKVRSVERNYVTPNESPIILKKVADNRENVSFVFVHENPLITSIPKRAKENKAKTELSFDASLNPTTNMFENWTMHDLTNITTSFTQSHASSRDWSKNLLKALVIDNEVTESSRVHEKDKNGKKIKYKIGLKKGAYKFKDKPILKKITLDDGRFFEIKVSECSGNTRGIGNVVNDMLISLLSRLFKSYDPISLANGKKDKLISLLKERDYEDSISYDKIPISHEERKECKDAWNVLDNISSRTELKKIIMLLLKNYNAEVIDRIDNAAKASGEAIRNVFIEKLETK